MNNLMKLFVIFVLFVQIQTALPQPIQSTQRSSLIQQVCKRNHYQALCIYILNLDPRSKASNLQGLALISIDATRKKVNEALDHLLSVFKHIGRREEFEMYGTCIEEYGATVRRFLPAVLADLKAKKYSQAVSDIKNVVSVPGICNDQFAGTTPLPLAGLNKAVHDIADMTAEIIQLFSTN